MGAMPVSSQGRKITFSREGLVQSVAGILCAMAKDAKFSSTHLSKFIQYLHGNLLCSEFAQMVDLENDHEVDLDQEGRAKLAAESFRIHGQSLQNLIQYWNDEKFIKRVSGIGRKTLFSVTERGLRNFMEQVYICEVGLNELRVDHLLLSLYTIRSIPLAIIQEVSPGQVDTWHIERTEIKWDWKTARDRYVGLLESRRKRIEEYNDTNDQLPEYFAEAKKRAGTPEAAAVIATLPGLHFAFSDPLVSFFAFRSQRDQDWHQELRVLANMYASFRPSYTIHDMEEGVQYRSSILYTPMVQTIGQVIRTLERLK